MKVKNKDGVLYADYNLNNLDHLMSYLIGKALKHYNVGISVKEYESFVESQSQGIFRKEAVITYISYVDLLMLQVPKVNGKSIDLAFVRENYEGDGFTYSSRDDFTGVPVKRISDKEFEEIEDYFKKNIISSKPKGIGEHSLFVKYNSLVFNDLEKDTTTKILHVSNVRGS